MTKIYACLLGNWVCLNDDPDCKFIEKDQSPALWWEEGAELYAPETRKKSEENSFYNLDYVHIYYRGKTYRINPMFIQIVDE